MFPRSGDIGGQGTNAGTFLIMETAVNVDLWPNRKNYVIFP